MFGFATTFDVAFNVLLETTLPAVSLSFGSVSEFSWDPFLFAPVASFAERAFSDSSFFDLDVLSDSLSLAVSESFGTVSDVSWDSCLLAAVASFADGTCNEVAEVALLSESGFLDEVFDVLFETSLPTVLGSFGSVSDVSRDACFLVAVASFAERTCNILRDVRLALLSESNFFDEVFDTLSDTVLPTVSGVFGKVPDVHEDSCLPAAVASFAERTCNKLGELALLEESSLCSSPANFAEGECPELTDLLTPL